MSKVMVSVKWGDDRLLCSAWLHSLYLQHSQTLPKLPCCRLGEGITVLTLIKAHCLKKSSLLFTVIESKKERTHGGTSFSSVTFHFLVIFFVCMFVCSKDETSSNVKSNKHSPTSISNMHSRVLGTGTWNLLEIRSQC